MLICGKTTGPSYSQHRCSAKATHFFSKKFQHICIWLNVNFNELLTNDIVSFEQLGLGWLACCGDWSNITFCGISCSTLFALPGSIAYSIACLPADPGVLYFPAQSRNFPGPSCSKLMTLLVNNSLKFSLSDTQICWNFLLKKCE